MKRLILSIILVAIAVSCFAQTGLKGTWSQKHSMFGISGNETLTFSDNKAGTVENHCIITFNISQFGVKLSGEAVCNINGKYTYEGDKINIHWDVDNIQFEVTKPLKVTHKGEEVEDAKGELAEMFNEAIDELKNTPADEIYTDVRISDKKLTYKSLDEKGKKQSDTYNRVK